ncbi:hemin uptake protein HemP [Hyphomicrobium sp. CS1GBMeth3]|uniref:hemin uptake protein HemP n=1 Tax=Hyphomicrobium sp. CS1GBMeth3 TaxID=1892845 RepID=UPI00092FDC0A|nr:hemin uptake protein HemP [Hyphomicrobium sp. CS1GBMeth3]
MSTSETKTETEAAAVHDRAPRVVRYVVSELMQGSREAILEHDGAEYHLRITANGRLILTK